MLHTFKMVDTHSEIPYIRSDWLPLLTGNPMGARHIPQTNWGTLEHSQIDTLVAPDHTTLLTYNEMVDTHSEIPYVRLDC